MYSIILKKTFEDIKKGTRSIAEETPRGTLEKKSGAIPARAPGEMPQETFRNLKRNFNKNFRGNF